MGAGPGGRLTELATIGGVLTNLNPYPQSLQAPSTCTRQVITDLRCGVGLNLKILMKLRIKIYNSARFFRSKFSLISLLLISWFLKNLM